MEHDLKMLYVGSLVEHNLTGEEPVNAISIADRDSYFAVLLQAFRVYLDRENVRHGLWKQYPARDQVQQIKIKAERVVSILDREENTSEELAVVLEELRDIINYAVFGYRITEEGKVE